MVAREPLILVINPGSTSTRVGLFDGEQPRQDKTVRHPPEELSRFATLWDQLEFRLAFVWDALAEWTRSVADLDAVVGRGGLLKPVDGGVYRVTERMLEDARRGIQGEHAANLGCALAWEVARRADVPAFVVDPVSVDEFEPLARLSGHPQIPRRSLTHALSVHALARDAAHRIGRPLEQTRFIVGHLGGGISVCAVRSGRIIDANDASSEGPFSPERTGGLPLQPVITLCFSGRVTESEMRRMVMGRGGLVAYLGTTDAAAIEGRIARGDTYAAQVYEAMAYQIAKEISAMAAVLNGRVDAILLTGGLSRSDLLVGWIRQRVEFIAPVIVLGGEIEMRALAAGARRVLMGEETAKEYV